MTGDKRGAAGRVQRRDTQTAPAGALDAAPVCLIATLAPMESEDCAASYTVTQADLNYGSVTDTEVSHCTPPTPPGGTTPSLMDSTSSPASVPVD